VDSTLSSGEAFADSVAYRDNISNPNDLMYTMYNKQFGLWRVFDLNNTTRHFYWLPYNTTTVSTHWIAFKYYERTLFRYAKILGGFVEGENSDGTALLCVQNVNIYVSNDSTDGIDGEWELLRSNVFDGVLKEDTQGVIMCATVPLCNEDSVIYTTS